jgi:hypothetical protein
MGVDEQYRREDPAEVVDQAYVAALRTAVLATAPRFAPAAVLTALGIGLTPTLIHWSSPWIGTPAFVVVTAALADFAIGLRRLPQVVVPHDNLLVGLRALYAAAPIPITWTGKSLVSQLIWAAQLAVSATSVGTLAARLTPPAAEAAHVAAGISAAIVYLAIVAGAVTVSNGSVRTAEAVAGFDDP